MKCCLILTLVTYFADFGAAKSIEFYRLFSPHAISKNFIPVYSAAQDFAESVDNERPEDTKLILLNPLENAQTEKQELRNVDPAVESSIDTGRTFKHFMLLKSLMNSGSDYSRPYEGGYNRPYRVRHNRPYRGGQNGLLYPIIINTPLNLTNLNNNTIASAPTPAPAGGGGGGGGAGGFAGQADNIRINLMALPQQQWPMQMQLPMQNIQMPTEVYHERKASTIYPTYTIAMLNMAGHPPLPLTQYNQYSSNSNYRNEQPKIFRWPTGYNKSPQGPIATFANTLRGVEYL